VNKGRARVNSGVNESGEIKQVNLKMRPKVP